MTNTLINKKCVPCEGGEPPLNEAQISKFKSQIGDEWGLIEPQKGPKEAKKIQRKFKFKDFKKAMEFVNKVADLAEEEGHHPDISIHWNRVTLTLWTHAIGGLSENDFIMAAKINELL